MIGKALSKHKGLKNRNLPSSLPRRSRKRPGGNPSTAAGPPSSSPSPLAAARGRERPLVAGGGGAFSSPRVGVSVRAGCLWPDAALGAGRGSSVARRRGLSAAHASDAMGSAVVVQAGGWWWRWRAQIRLWRRELRATWVAVGLPYHGSWAGGGQRVDACAVARSGPCGRSTSHGAGDSSGGHPWMRQRALLPH
ncbi:hypothetical protein VPH35_052210 [Triticum aestivum]|uniref:Uncharacterized protein n=1 Tax=Triticum aestivum TaxID=4565 RepID=A0A077S1S7_WHEAT|nr:unnamed protein product [Triticum aestivum]